MSQFMTYERVLLSEVWDYLWLQDGRSLDLTHLVRQSSTSSVNSFVHVRAKIHDILRASESLVEMFDRLEARKDLDRLCYDNGHKMMVCASLVTLLSAAQAVTDLDLEVRSLNEILQDGERGLQNSTIAAEGSMLCAAPLANRLLRASLKTLWEGEAKRVTVGREMVQGALFQGWEH